MIYLIKESFTREESADFDGVCITPQSFKMVDWSGKTVTGLKYYVDKAVEMGATALEVDKPKRTRKKAAD